MMILFSNDYWMGCKTNTYNLFTMFSEYIFILKLIFLIIINISLKTGYFLMNKSYRIRSKLYI